MNKFILILYFITNFSSIFSQNCIEGNVIDKQTQQFLPFVSVQALPGKETVSTDINGKFKLKSSTKISSIQCFYIGYKKKNSSIQQNKELTIYLEPSIQGLDEIIIQDERKDDPAIAIIKKVIQYKPKNNPESLNYVEYEEYSKVLLSLNNIDSNFRKKRAFKNVQFIFDRIDSSYEKPALPLLLIEKLADVYLKKEGKHKKELVKATQILGIKDEGMSQLLGHMQHEFNLYQEHLELFGKNFVSPVGKLGRKFYRIYLEDTVYIGDKLCFKLSFYPKRKQDPAFKGEVWINDSTFAIKKIRAELSEGANINFINKIWFEQEFEPTIGDSAWVKSKNSMLIDFDPEVSNKGIYGLKTTTYKYIKVNFAHIDQFYTENKKFNLDPESLVKDKNYWVKNRHFALTTKEFEIAGLIDTLKHIPEIKTSINVVKTIASGYKRIGKIDVGPIYKFVRFNKVEQVRLKFRILTNKHFHKNLQIHSGLGYATRLKKFQGELGFRYRLTKNLRNSIGIAYNNELQLVNNGLDIYQKKDLFLNILRRHPINKLFLYEELKINYQHEWKIGLDQWFVLRKRNITPIGDFGKFKSINYKERPIFYTKNRIFEIVSYIRWSFNEKWIDGAYDRIRLGTKYPIIEFQITQGIKSPNLGEIKYTRMFLRWNHHFKILTFGKSKYRIEVGKIWGSVPYSLLETHYGNDGRYGHNYTFNTMNQYEFTSDQFACIFYEHHFDGFFLNSLPLIRQLKWREVLSVNAIVGSLSNRHQNTYQIPEFTHILNQPFVEAGVGIENILKIIRIDAMWRLTNSTNLNAIKFGIVGRLNFSF